MITKTTAAKLTSFCISKSLPIIGLMILIFCSTARPAFATDINYQDGEIFDKSKQHGLAITHLGQDKVIAAYQSRQGYLNLSSFRVSADGSLSMLDRRRSGGRITDVDLIPFGQRSDQVVGATSGDRHKVIVWSLENDQITRIGDSGTQAGASQLSAIVKLSDHLVLTAVKTTGGRLKLITWEISSGGRKVTRLRDSLNQAGNVREVALVQLSPNWVVTAVTTNDHKLKLISWEISDSGYVIKRRGAGSAGEAHHLSMVKLTPFRVLVSMADSSDRLKLISWNVGTFGSGFITRVASTQSFQAGKVNGTDTTVFKSFGENAGVVTAVITDNDRRKLITWNIPTTTNAPINRTGESRGGGFLDLSEHKAGMAAGFLVASSIVDNETAIVLTDYQVVIKTYLID